MEPKLHEVQSSFCRILTPTYIFITWWSLKNQTFILIFTLVLDSFCAFLWGHIVNLATYMVNKLLMDVFGDLLNSHCHDVMSVERYSGQSTLSLKPPHDKTNKKTCAPSEDSDQPGHPLSAQPFCWFCHVAAHLSVTLFILSTGFIGVLVKKVHLRVAGGKWKYTINECLVCIIKIFIKKLHKSI